MAAMRMDAMKAGMKPSISMPGTTQAPMSRVRPMNRTVRMAVTMTLLMPRATKTTGRSRNVMPPATIVTAAAAMRFSQGLPVKRMLPMSAPTTSSAMVLTTRMVRPRTIRCRLPRGQFMAVSYSSFQTDATR